ncbi:Adenosylcobinamide-GDP ribazoletransferase [Hartmannibacter diazotrophicus]|uniref:Adenosylcobinamide-GDP ribazoletransferase n=1 Tax=Hartmannibacter diazotrophicus TaxID=1482074 RepID=A0A2C9D456_9HYPH|nr:adenosylcobinamide-GDP ribazoletransferase [Hartmannibacter diazotrophicus]SON55092.1 Adenosylcobinamide-GDP ribazoletransferase [Hartmannibacter diazotrophicus]
MPRAIADLAAVVRFYSRLPVPKLGRDDDPSAMPDLRRAGVLVPVAGALIAIPSSLAMLVLAQSHLPQLAVAVAGLAVMALVTGAFHEDGLGDIADGFGGGQTKERKLEIMKDSRVGAFAAVAIALALIARASLLAGALEASPLGTALAFLGASAASRAFPLWIWRLLPPARSDGLAASIPVAGFGPTTGASLLAVLITLATMPHFGTGSVLLALLAAALATALVGYLAKRNIGGHTGDVLGGAQQIAEIGFFAGLLL